MNKLVVAKEAKDVIDIRKSAADNLHAIAKALNRDVRDLTVFILDKERHRELIADVRSTGARISLHTDGDVMGGLMATIPGTGVDVLMGVGGTPEGVITAAAVKAMGGGMQAMRAPQLAEEKERLLASNIDLNQILGLDDLIQAEDAFFAATGITGGSFLEGVHFDRDSGVSTHSIVIRAITGSIRYIKGVHPLKRPMDFKNRDIDGTHGLEKL